MKCEINGWSVVASPAGVSLRPINPNGSIGDGELCVRLENGWVIATAYNNAIDEVSQMAVPVKILKQGA